MEIIYTILASILSLVVLFVLTKVMGNRQMSQMSMFDYIIGISIGSISAEFATADDITKPFVAMIIYAIVAVCISIFTCGSIAARKFFNGKPTVLYENGKLYEKNMKSAKMDMNEFLTQCRVSGYFDLSKLEAAILETNGQVSFMPLAEERPVTPADLQMKPTREALVINVIIDGKVLDENLKVSGNNDEWLRKELEAQHAKVEDVFLATCDIENTLVVFKYTNEKYEREIFE